MDTPVLAGIKKYSRKQKVVKRLNPLPVLVVLSVAGLALRLLFLRYRFAVSFDEVNYAKLGVSGHLNGLSDILHTYWSPLLPSLISAFCKLFPDYELAARMVSVVAGILLLVPVYFLGKAIYDERVGMISAGFVALFPPIAFQSTLILTEPLTMLFGTLAVLFGLRMLKQYSTAFALLSGLASGLAYLTHPQGLSFGVIVAFWVVLGALSRLFLIRPLRVVYLLVPLALGFVVVAAPYLLFLKKTTGTWTLSAKASANLQMATPIKGKSTSFRDLDAANETVPIDQVFHQGTFLQATEGGESPVREVKLTPLLRKYLKNVANILQRALPQVLTTLPLMLLGVGMLGTTWSPQQGKKVLYLFSFVAFWALILIPAFHINLRYLTPLWPIFAIWIGQGATVIHTWLSGYMPVLKMVWRKKVSAHGLAWVTVVGAFCVLSFLPEFGRVLARSSTSREYVADPVGQKLAGLWLKENVPANPVIMSRNHAVDFYAGSYDITKSVTIPTSSFERILEYARNRRVDYLVLNERYLKNYPQLDFLLGENQTVEDLKLLYRERDPSGFVTAVYKLL